MVGKARLSQMSLTSYVNKSGCPMVKLHQWRRSFSGCRSSEHGRTTPQASLHGISENIIWCTISQQKRRRWWAITSGTGHQCRTPCYNISLRQNPCLYLLPSVQQQAGKSTSPQCQVTQCSHCRLMYCPPSRHSDRWWSQDRSQDPTSSVKLHPLVVSLSNFPPTSGLYIQFIHLLRSDIYTVMRVSY